MDESELLARYRAVRLPDVSDALDCRGFADRYIMSPSMRPMWEGIRFAGVAHTLKLVPSPRVLPAMSYEEYVAKSDEMTDGCYRFVGSVGPDEVMVIDAEGISAGLLGSDVVMALMEKGVVGMVIDGACRDAREVRLERAPVFATVRTCAHVMGRLAYGSENETIHCAGVRVSPADIVLADEDGVLVVPRPLAERALAIAEDILRRDKESRRRKYEALGLEPDDSLV
jgi:4-hydroxy-4-methyl-2-oxoglutarate aldolase